MLKVMCLIKDTKKCLESADVIDNFRKDEGV